tara:strand:- start:98 stop:820 length:723 start_codon:yes stop_codon:yes gene_type:complete
MFKKKPKKEILISKFIEDLPGMQDILRDSRSYSPDRLTDACNNIKFNASQELDPIENLTIQFMFRKLIYIMHQTGLYNPQRRFFNHLASTAKIEVKEYNKLSKKDDGKISDIYFYDIHNKYILVRLEHPNSNLDFVALPKLLSDANNQRCAGAVYISNQIPSEQIIEKIRAKTNYSNPHDRYMSPINDYASFNLFTYKASPNSVVYTMLHPDLAKGESAQGEVPAQLISALYDDSVAPVG